MPEPGHPLTAGCGVEGSEPDELEQLSKLLWGISRSDIAEMHERVGNRAHFTENLSGSLAEAVRRASEDDAFRSSMSPVVAEGVLQTARREPFKLGEAIAPALGPAIRGMISLALEKMNQRIEARVQTTLSIRGLKWRLESSRTGVPLSEIVLRETMVFRVEHALLIHEETGLLLCNASQDGATGRDPAVVSSMVAAVREFVVDAFANEERAAESQSHRIGDVTAFVETLGGFALVAVVRGVPTAALLERLREVLERVCLQFGEEAHGFNGDISPFSVATPLLEECLLEKAKSTRPGARSRGPSWFKIGLVSLGLLGLGALAFRGYQSYQDGERWQKFKASIHDTPGLVLIEIVQKGSTREVRALRDPLAARPKQLAEEHGYSSADVVWKLRPYSSLDETIVLARARKRLRPPPSVEWELAEGRLWVSGQASQDWVEQSSRIGPTVPGIDEIDLEDVVGSPPTWWAEAKKRLETTQVFFELGAVTVAPDSNPALNLLQKLHRKLVQSAARHNASVRVVVNIDPRSVAPNVADDVERAQRRVMGLAALDASPGEQIELGQVRVSKTPPVDKRPYASFQLDIEEH